MRKFALLICLSICFTAGGMAQEPAQEPITMTISGAFTDVPEDIELTYHSVTAGLKRDFIRIPMTDGRFSVTIACNPIEVVVLDLRREGGERPLKDGYTYYSVGSVFPVQGANVTLEGEYKEAGDNPDYVVSGEPMSEQYYRLDRTKEILAKEAEKEFLAGSQDEASLEAIREKLRSEITALYEDCYAKNRGNLFGDIYCIHFFFSEAGDIDEKRTLMSQVAERFRGNHLMSIMQADLNSEIIKKDPTLARPATVNQPDVDDVPVSLLDICAKNKYVLLDFWASWCGPCIAEFPALTAAYDEYKDKGFEIYAVSLDTDKERWEAAMVKYNTPWINVGDMHGWQNTAAVEYGVTSIPDNLLLDSKGNVVALGLRGKELETKIEELLGNK